MHKAIWWDTFNAGFMDQSVPSHLLITTRFQWPKNMEKMKQKSSHYKYGKMVGEWTTPETDREQRDNP